MPLPLPNLDDRDFEQLLAQAMQRIRQSNTAWDDLTPHDPGIVLLELFAYLTDTMIYRLNRLPEKVYIAFLRLLGVSLRPPSAASTTLRFTRARGQEGAVEIPRGTRVTLERTGGSSNPPPVFMTTQAVTLAADAESVDAPAVHAEQVDGELAGTANGLAGFYVTVARAPLIAPTGDPLDLVVGVEAAEGELDDRAPAVQYEGRAYRIWREVENFANVGDDRFVYTVDRNAGMITFAPSLDPENGSVRFGDGLLGEAPTAGRAVRVWYRRGGGAEGNVAANTLTAFKETLRGVTVSNPAPATGGRDAETLENALLRGPKELHSLERAVTASDFELVALKTLGIARAKAFTRAALWSYAQRGTVEVVLVPAVPESAWQGSHLPASTLEQYCTDEVRAQVQQAIDERRPLGTTAVVNCAHYKTVRVAANIVVRREENADAVKSRVLERLNRMINPLPSDKFNARGWAFGQALRVSNIYDVALGEPGVRYVDNVSLIVDDVPKAVTSVVADAFQPQTWYAASENRVFRSMNDGDGWEVAFTFAEDERVEFVRTHPAQAGYVAAAVRVGDTEASRIFVSADCGESWQVVANTDFHVEDMTWLRRDKLPVLLLATDKGLYELVDPAPERNLVQVLVTQQNQALSFYSVTTATDVSGGVTVAVAAQNSGGVFISTQGGRTNTFRKIEGMEGLDVRVLAVQTDGPRNFLWAGTFAFGDEPGRGCYRWELRGDEDPPEGWETFTADWNAGSCRGLTFIERGVLAATHRGGILYLDSTQNEPKWQSPDINSGLPLRDLSRGRFVTIDTIAANPAGTLALAGVTAGDEQASGAGVYKAPDQGDTYTAWKFTLSSVSRFTDRVTLPETWLFASGAHEINVVGENETR